MTKPLDANLHGDSAPTLSIAVRAARPEYLKPQPEGITMRAVQLIALVLLITCSFVSSASAQRRRNPRRAPAPRTRLAPLTAEQKAATADIIERVKALEITYNYNSKRYADDAFDVSSKSGEVGDTLPEGMVKDLLLDMWGAWRAAAFIYGECLPSEKGVYHAMYNLSLREAEMAGKRTDLTNPIPEIVKRYNLQSMHPCRAQRELFNYARIITFRVRVVLDASPTARTAQTSIPTRGNSETKTALKAPPIHPDTAPRPPSPEIKCTSDMARAPELRGFRLGMDFSQVVSRFLGINFFPNDVGPNAPVLRELKIPDEFGQLLMELKFLRMHDLVTEDIRNTTTLDSVRHSTVSAVLNTRRFSDFEGVDWVKIRFVDGRITSLRVEYDDTVKWDGNDEFIKRSMEALGLSGTWHRGPAGGGQVLTCEGFSVSVGFDYGKPFVQLKDLVGEQTLEGRISKKQGEQRTQEVERKKAFKP